MRRCSRLAVVVASALMTACSSTVSPSPSLAPPSPSLTSQDPSSNTLTLSLHAIDQTFTTPILAVATDGKEIAWSRGEKVGGIGAWQLWAVATTAGAVPRLVYSGPRHNTQLLPITVRDGHYAWVELGAQGEWWLWYLARPDAPPVELDHATSPDWSPPALALGTGRLVWTAVHGAGDAAKSEMTSMDLATGQREVVRSVPAHEMMFTWPSLAGDRLTYATIAGGVDGVRHVMQHDFSRSGPDQQLDKDGRAGLPTSSGTALAWKSADNEYTWGQLVIYSPTGGPQQVAFGDEIYINYPTVGDRYVVAWAWDDTRLWVYDLASDRAMLVEQFERTGLPGDVRPTISGNLLVFLRAPQTDNGQLTLMWARLPA